jgi:hypothetical protein
MELFVNIAYSVKVEQENCISGCSFNSFLGVRIWLFLFQVKFIFTGKTIVSNLKIDNLNRSSSVITFGVNNLHNSPITAIGVNVS